MKRQTIFFLFLFFSLIQIPFLVAIFNLGGEIFGGALWDSISLIIVYFGAILFFLTTFTNTKKCLKPFFIYKLIWLQEMFIISGLFGTIIGFVLLLISLGIIYPTGVDPMAVTISNVAVALLTMIYGFLGALTFYLIQKYIEMHPNAIQTIEIEKPKEGFQILSLIYFFIFVTLEFFTINILSTRSGGISHFIPFESIYYILIIVLILIFLYKGNSFLWLYKNLFWYRSDSEKNIIYNLKYIRNVKKVLAMLICVSLLCTPVVMLVVMALPPEEGNILGWNILSFSGLKNGGLQFFWGLNFIIILTIIEGREVSKLYFETGKVSAGDRFYSIKYILAPSFFMFFIFSFGVIQYLLF